MRYPEYVGFDEKAAPDKPGWWILGAIWVRITIEVQLATSRAEFGRQET